MKLNPWAAAAVLTMLAFPLQAANEPEAGAIVRKDTEVTPKAEFSPGNMTDIMPSLSENKKKKSRKYIFSRRDGDGRSQCRDYGSRQCYRYPRKYGTGLRPTVV